MPDKQSLKEALETIRNYRNRGNLDQADLLCRKLLHENPSHPELVFHLGQINFDKEHYREAVKYLLEASQQQPDNAEIHFYLAACLQQQGDYKEAEKHYKKVLQTCPRHAESHCNLGVVYDEQDLLEKAIECYQMAISIKPDYAVAYNNLGALLQRQGRAIDAGSNYRSALQLQPDNIAWQIRKASLCPDVLPDEESIWDYRRKLAERLAEFTERNIRIDPVELVTCGIYPPYALMYHGTCDLQIRKDYARVFRNCFPEEIPQMKCNHDRYRIGFVVTRGHEGIFVKSMRGILMHMDRDTFESVIICPAATANEVRAGIPDQSIQILAVPERIDLMAAAIRSAALHILYYWEIATDATNYFLPFYRLAPVQCTSWGIQVTSGIPSIDYYLSSSMAEPKDADSNYSEQLACADTLLTYQHRAPQPQNVSRSHFGFSDQKTLYVCVQQLGKLHPDFDNVLAEILRRDPNGLLVLTRDKYSYKSEELSNRFNQSIPDVIDQIVFLPRQSHTDYLHLIAIADVLLDPPYYGGVNTSYDGFSLNKPIVTLPSQYHIGRYTAACYWKTGYTECVADSPDDYVNIAVALGTDKEHRKHASESIAATSPVLFEDMQAVHEHERLFRKLADTIA